MNRFSFVNSTGQQKETRLHNEIVFLISDIGKSCLGILFFVSLWLSCWNETEDIISVGPNKYGLASPEILSLARQLQEKLTSRFKNIWKGEQTISNLIIGLKNGRVVDFPQLQKMQQMPKTSQNLTINIKGKMNTTMSDLSRWRVYDNTAGFIVSCLHLYYVEGLTHKWRKWYPKDAHDCPFLGLFENVFLLRTKTCVQILKGLDPSQGAKALRDMRLFVARTCTKAKDPEDSDFEELENLHFQKPEDAPNNKGPISFKDLLPLFTSCKWRTEVIGKDNSVEIFGNQSLSTPKLVDFLRKKYHHHLIQTPSQVLLRTERQLKVNSLSFPVNIFKPKQEVKKINFPNIGKKNKIKKEALFIHNREQSNAEIYFLVNKKFKKTQIMESLFEKQRISGGFELKFSEDVESISHVRGHSQFNFSGFEGRFKGMIERLRVYFQEIFEGESTVNSEADWTEEKMNLNWVIDLSNSPRNVPSEKVLVNIWDVFESSGVFKNPQFSPTKSTKSSSGNNTK